MRSRSRSSATDISSVSFCSCLALCRSSAVRWDTLLSSVAVNSRKASSACLRSEISSTRTMKYSGRPASSRWIERVRLTQTRLPSLRT